MAEVASQLVLRMVLLIAFVIPAASSRKDANIILILTDDQDTMLTGTPAQENIIRHIAKEGVTFENAFVTTPICCPSRSSILTGRYISSIGVFNNSISGNCGGELFRDTSENETFAAYIKRHKPQYNTFYAGKYLNGYGLSPAMDVSHVPQGWDWWMGLVGNSRYYDYDVSLNGIRKHHGKEYERDYFTDVIANASLQFIQSQTDARPFMMTISTPAVHSPFDFAPKYKDAFLDVKSPRVPSFNVKGKNKHWLVGNFTKAPMNDEYVKVSDIYYQHRLRALLSVDELVVRVVKQLESQKLLDDTYLIFSSDNGYHMGEFAMYHDKRMPYDFDLRVPMYIKGPEIEKNVPIKEAALSIDLMPTILDMAGIAIPSNVDGKSLLATSRNVNTEDNRRIFCVEYFGEDHKEYPQSTEFGDPFVPGVQSPPGLTGCSSLNTTDATYCEDAINNTYQCARIYDSTMEGLNVKICSFKDDQRFVEAYDLTKDKFELKNLAKEPSVGGDTLTRTYKQLEMSVNNPQCPCCEAVLKGIKTTKMH